MALDLMPGFGAFTQSSGVTLPSFPAASAVSYEAVPTPPIWNNGLRTTGQTDPLAGTEAVLYSYDTESSTSMGGFSGRGLLTNGAAYSYSTGTTYTLSVYAKQVGSNGRYLRFQINDAEAGDGGVLFDLQTGAVASSRAGSITETNTGIIDVGDGWYQCYFSVTGLDDVINNIQVGPSNVDSTNFDASVEPIGGTAHGVLLWRMQIVSGTDPNG